MNSVMIDNWMMQNIVKDFYNLSDEISIAYAQFLQAIVLWDDIYYPCNEMSSTWNQLSNIISSIMHPIDDDLHMFDEQAQKLYEDKYADNELGIVAGGAIRYLLLSDYFNCDYLPSEERQQFLKRVPPYDIANQIILNRINCITALDSSINEQFIELGERLGGINFKIKTPVLVDFIIQNTPENMSYIDFALHLRLENSVVQYKNYLSDLENALENNDFTVLIDMVNYSNEIVSELVNLDKKSIGNIEIVLAPMPSISFSKDLSIKKRRIHLSFLEALGRFAFKGRKYN